MVDTFRKNYNNSLHELHTFEKEMKEIAEQLENKFKSMQSASHQPSAREISLALTNLEQSIMWATKGLYKKNKDEENG